MTEPRIHMRHVQAMRSKPRICKNGIRAWAAQHGIDLRRFAAEGVAGEEALRIGDAFALQLLDIARKEAADNGR